MSSEKNSEYNAKSLYSLLKEHSSHLQELYKYYSLAVQDEGLRKFLNSMGSQAQAHQETLEEHAAQLTKCSAHTQSIADIAGRISCTRKPFNDLTRLPRMEFLEYMLTMEKYTAQLYSECEASCPSDQLKELAHSLREDEKRHIALLEDRFELEQLL